MGGGGLRSLQPPSGADLYPLLAAPHLLAAARFLLCGLARPAAGGAAAAALAAARAAAPGGEAGEAAVADPRVEALHATTDALHLRGCRGGGGKAGADEDRGCWPA